MMTIFSFIFLNRVPTADGKSWEPVTNAFGPYLIIDDDLSDGSYYLSEYTISSREGLTAVKK